MKVNLMKRASHVWVSCVFVLAASLLAGCGGGGVEKMSTVPASGTVYVGDATHGPATLTLTPVSSGDGDERPVLGAEVKADGSFAVTTYEAGDGAVPGAYTVTLSGPTTDPGSTDPDAMMAMMSGAGGPSTAALEITIPEEGSTSLELKFTETAAKKAPANAPLGTN